MCEKPCCRYRRGLFQFAYLIDFLIKHFISIYIDKSPKNGMIVLEIIYTSYLIMKKFLYALATVAVLTMLVSGCAVEPAPSAIPCDTPTEIPAAYEEVKVVNVLLTVGSDLRSSSTVVYLLLENNDVVILKRRASVREPLTKEEARAVMAFQRGDTVTVKVAK